MIIPMLWYRQVGDSDQKGGVRHEVPREGGKVGKLILIQEVRQWLISGICSVTSNGQDKPEAISWFISVIASCSVKIDVRNMYLFVLKTNLTLIIWGKKINLKLTIFLRECFSISSYFKAENHIIIQFPLIIIYVSIGCLLTSGLSTWWEEYEPASPGRLVQGTRGPPHPLPLSPLRNNLPFLKL